MDGQAHWQRVWGQHRPEEVSWFEAVPERSLALIAEAGIDRDDAVIDVGGGAAHLAGELVNRGYRNIAVADISAHALEDARLVLGERADQIEWIEADVRDHDFGREFELWHDRAVLHFMVEQADRDGYLKTLRRSLRRGGHLIVATFGPEGPTRCSGLPVDRYRERELMELLGDEFALVSSRLGTHYTPSGVGQQFLYLHARRTESPENRTIPRSDEPAKRPAPETAR